MNLFSAMPDGDCLFSIKNVYDELAYPSKDDPNIKLLNVEINGKNFTNIGYYKKVKLEVDKNAEKIYIRAMKNDKVLNLETSWSFDLLKERLELKLKNLAIVETMSKNINGEYYFFYSNIKFYKLENFEAFIDLIEKGIVKLKFQISTHKDAENYGTMRVKGTTFTINKKDILLLFDELDIGLETQEDKKKNL